MFDESKKIHRKFLKMILWVHFYFPISLDHILQDKEQNLKLTVELANPILFVLQLIISINNQNHYKCNFV